MGEEPLDPMVYLARPIRDEKGTVRSLEIIYDSESVTVAHGNEFITIQTRVLLEELVRHEF